MAVFFLKAPPSTASHNIELGGQGCLTVLARIQVGWLLSFEEPGKPVSSQSCHFIDLHWYPHWRGKLLCCPQTAARKLWE